MLEAIKQRRSVRSYKPDPVPPEAIQEIIEAAMSAPSGLNARVWHLIVVTDQAKREALSRISQYAWFCAESPVVIAVCGDAEASPHWWIEDCVAATENALIQAAALGLGTCWIGVRGGETRSFEREDAVHEILGIPEAIRVECIFSLGYPADEGANRGPGPLEQAHYEGW